MEGPTDLRLLPLSYIFNALFRDIPLACQGWLLPLRSGKIPYGGVALTQWEELKFLAGINHNTPFVFMHGIDIMHDINSLQGIALVPATFESFVASLKNRNINFRK